MATEHARGGDAGVVVEFGFEAPLGAAALASLRDAVAAVADGRSLGPTFAWRNGMRVVCVVEGNDEIAVSACLRAAGLAPSAVWPCAELDPVPPKLFGTAAPLAARHPAAADPSESGTQQSGVAVPEGSRETAGERAIDAVIIGAGLSGIAMLEKLLRLGLSVRLYDDGNDVGGVWHWNRYPGARIDSEAYTYGFSFSDALLREWDWRELFAAQPEMSSYLRHVVDSLGLRTHMRLGTRVEAASYDAPNGRWSVSTDSGERLSARYLIAAVGTLSAPQMPAYPGVDAFAGESYHTARWPARGVKLAGKRVGVIGTGASGVQVIQTIAGEVDHLTVFQRTPTYCLPQRNRALTDEDRRQIRRDWNDIPCRVSRVIRRFHPYLRLASRARAVRRRARGEVRSALAEAGFRFLARQLRRPHDEYRGQCARVRFHSRQDPGARSRSRARP